MLMSNAMDDNLILWDTHWEKNSGIRAIHHKKKLSIRAFEAMKLFEVTLTPVITYGLHFNWDKFNISNVDEIEYIKSRS